MAEPSTNPLTKSPAAGPGFVDRYYKSQGIRPPHELLRDPESLVDKLEQTSPEERQKFFEFAKKQLDTYYKVLEGNPEDQKRVSQILGNDLEARDALRRYTNLEKSVDKIVQLFRSGVLDQETLDPAVQKGIVDLLKKNNVTVSGKPPVDEIREKLREFGLGLIREREKTSAQFYHRLAWALWKSPKSTGMDKLVARDFLDAAWSMTVPRSPTGGRLTEPGIYNALLRKEIEAAFSKSGIKPFQTHQAFLKGNRQSALEFLERLPEKAQKMLEAQEKRGQGKEDELDLFLVPAMREFQKKAATHVFPALRQYRDKAFTARKVEQAVRAPGSVPTLEEAARTFGNYLEVASHNPDTSAKLQHLITWEYRDTLLPQVEKIRELSDKVFDAEGNVVNKRLEKTFQKELRSYYLLLADALLKDTYVAKDGTPRTTPEERAIAADYVNAAHQATEGRGKKP